MRCFLMLILCLCGIGALAEEHVRESEGLLVDAETLVAHLANEDQFDGREVRLIDVRPFKEYQVGNIRGARHVDVSEWKAAFGDGSDAKPWSERLSQGGLIADENQTVVVYDSSTSPNATRIWWVLKYWGVEDVRILDGGFNAWKQAGGEVYPMPLHVSSPPSHFSAEPQPARLATFQQVRSAIAGGEGGTCLVDTRTQREHSTGKIPTARHLDWQDLVDRDSGKLHNEERLTALFKQLNYDPQQSTITYCQSGGRASCMAFAMEHLTGEPAANYWGSWGEWSKKQESADGGR